MFGTPRIIIPPEAGKFGSETLTYPPLDGQFGSLFGSYLLQENGAVLLQENDGQFFY